MLIVGAASIDEMRQAAVNSGITGVTVAPNVATTTTSDRAGIINNAQPFSFTGAVGTDNVKEIIEKVEKVEKEIEKRKEKKSQYRVKLNAK
uniref:Uncharacterized protein n=1 Tax=Glossina brevipalpis TaxID=37001 RepID=A0A1A9WEM2_9MUSC